MVRHSVWGQVSVQQGPHQRTALQMHRRRQAVYGEVAFPGAAVHAAGGNDGAEGEGFRFGGGEKIPARGAGEQGGAVKELWKDF